MGKKNLDRKKNGDLAEKQEPEMLGLETFDNGDLVIPRFKIVQPTSKEGTPGSFRNNLTNEETDKLQIVALAAAKGRVCWTENIDEDPICRSSNGLVPSETIEKPINEKCGVKENGKRFEPVCSNALWGEDGERPECNEVINLLAVGREDHVPFFISLHGTQLKPVRAYLSAIGLRRRSLYEYQATMKLKETANGKGKFFVVQFEGLKENTGEEKEAFRAAYYLYAPYPIDRTFDAEKKMKENGNSDVPI